MHARARLWLLFGLSAPAWAQEVDGDGDGVPDAADRCPTEAEDRNGYQDHDGCPDERVRKLLIAPNDADGDGVPDATDKCPLVAENRNDFEDEDGCPESIYDSLTFEEPATPSSSQAAPAAKSPAKPKPSTAPASAGLPDRAPDIGGEPVCKAVVVGLSPNELGLVMSSPPLDLRCDDGRLVRVYDAPDIPAGTRGLLYCEGDKADPSCDLRVFWVDGTKRYHGSDCFFTTMVARVRGEADDGPTLTALRAFRDGPLAGHPDVATYYAIAPAIVASIEAHPAAAAIWQAVDEGWMRQILEDLAAERHGAAHRRYRHLVRVLSALAR
jgi:hypothetical protein